MRSTVRKVVRVADLICGLGCILLLVASSIAWGAEQQLESPVCGDAELPVAAGWRDQAERNGRFSVSKPGIMPISFDVNGTHLSGFKIDVESLSGGTIVSKGILLVVQGNAMLAEQIVQGFIPYARAGLDVYVVDFRGYGNSSGKPFLKAVYADLESIASALNNKSNRRLFVYGMSFGAGIALKLLNEGVPYRAAVIDAAPSRFLRLKLLCVIPVNFLQCANEYHPENNVPRDASRILFIHGSDDSVIRLCDAEELKVRAERAGGQFLVLRGFAHPGQDTAQGRDERHKIVLDFMSKHF